MSSILKVDTLQDVNGNAIISSDGSGNLTPNTFTALTVSGDLTVDTDTLKVDSSNNRLGIGTATPSGKLTVSGAGGSVGSNNIVYVDVTSSFGGVTVEATSGNNAFFELYEGGSKVGALAADATANTTAVQADGGHSLTFNTNGTTERMRIDGSGHLLVGTTSVISGGVEGVQIHNNAGFISTGRNTTSGASHHLFYNPNGIVGNIETSGSSTLYNTSSDYRLKENVVEITGAIERLKQLQPKRFNFIADSNTIVDGFLAHEVSSVVPEAITGTKDEVDADGNPVYQGIDPSKLVPLLTGALQEAIAKIETLEVRLNALEGQ